jgi:hypothetical protein
VCELEIKEMRDRLEQEYEMRDRLEQEYSDLYGTEEIESEDICVGCGMERSEWKGNHGQGQIKNGRIYCCRDCAEDIECTCGVRM